MTKRLSPVVVALIICSALCLSAFAQDQANTTPIQLDISGIPVQVIRDFRSTFKTRFIEVVIANEQYSRENLEKVWRHFCENYPDKKDRLDLRIFTFSTWEYNRQFKDQPLARLRGYEAHFEHMGDGAMAYGGDNELMIYCPDPTKPEEIVRVVLAGKDPFRGKQ